VEAVARSYDQFGQRKPVVATKDGTVIAGNHQLAAAKKLGWSEIAVVFVDDDELTAKAFALADNRTADLGTYDNELLAELIAEVSIDIDLLNATGYDMKTLETLINGEEITSQQLNGDSVSITEKFEVVIECDDEFQQESLLLRLSTEGLKVRAIIV